MDRQELQARIDAFPRWYYRFELDGLKTPVEPRLLARHAARYAHLFPPLLEACGGSLQGKRVLDLGCNSGFWALKAIEAGCDHVLGVDARQIHIDQATLVFDITGVPRHRFDFVTADACDVDLAAHGPFDVVLCLGLLYHLAAPEQLVSRISAVTSDVLLLDTRVHLGETAFIELHEGRHVPRNTVHDGPVLVPSRRAVEEMAIASGFHVSGLPFPALRPGMEDYADGRRVAFLCRKRPDSATLRRE